MSASSLASHPNKSVYPNTPYTVMRLFKDIKLTTDGGGATFVDNKLVAASVWSPAPPKESP